MTDEIGKLISFLKDSSNLELLSPDKMRSGKKTNYAQNIGGGGEALAYCIDKMSDKEKRQLNKSVSDLIGSNIEIQTDDLGTKVKLSIVNKSGKEIPPIDSLHISDGLLRIIAFAVMSMEKKAVFLSTEASNNVLKNGMVLLDEIENGINPSITERIIFLLRNLVEKSGRQVIITTHSPIIVNDIKPEEIIFLWKNDKSFVFSQKFFDTEEMREALTFLNPGEIWENFGKETILAKLGVKPENGK
jgi:predicted ATPase